MNREVMRVFIAALGFGLYLGLPVGGVLHAETAIASLDAPIRQVAAEEEAGSDDSGGDEGDTEGEGGESEDDSD